MVLTISRLIGERTRLARCLGNLTQEELAELCHVKVAKVRAWEQGDGINPQVVALLACRLGLPLSWLCTSAEDDEEC